ncbi:MAG TPA: hypothetical protein VIO80_10110 [Candidatus Dormibacteraeota bacterium]
MSGFSDDGQWWWDGATWVATAQVVLPQLPMTEFERSGKLDKARSGKKNAERLEWARGIVPLTWLAASALIVVGGRASRGYRSWTLEQLALATAYLLGPDEPMLAGEGGTLNTDRFSLPPLGRDLAVAVTAAHVLVFRIDSVDGQPRWIALAARSSDVTIEVRRGIRTTREAVVIGPDLVVSGWNGKWTIPGTNWFKPDPVLEAWRQATTGR